MKVNMPLSPDPAVLGFDEGIFLVSPSIWGMSPNGAI